MKSSPNSPLTCPGVVNFSRDISWWSATFQRRCPPHQAAISRTSRASLRLQIYLWHATPPLFRYVREILFRTACLSKKISSSRLLDRADTSWSLSLFLVIDECRLRGIERQLQVKRGDLCAQGFFFSISSLFMGFTDGFFSTEIRSDISLSILDTFAHISVYIRRGQIEKMLERYSLGLNEEKSRSYLMRGFLDPPRPRLSPGIGAWMLLLDF